MTTAPAAAPAPARLARSISAHLWAYGVVANLLGAAVVIAFLVFLFPLGGTSERPAQGQTHHRAPLRPG